MSETMTYETPNEVDLRTLSPLGRELILAQALTDPGDAQVEQQKTGFFNSN